MPAYGWGAGHGFVYTGDETHGLWGNGPVGLQPEKWGTGKGRIVSVSEYSVRSGGRCRAEGALGEGTACRALY